MPDWSKIGKKARSKGTVYERKTAVKISKLTGMTFRRTPYSGGGCVPGDIHRTDGPFRLVIECKNRKEVILDRIFKNPSIIYEYLDPNQLLIFNNVGKTFCVVDGMCIQASKLQNMKIWSIIPHQDTNYVLFPIEEFGALHQYLFEEE